MRITVTTEKAIKVTLRLFTDFCYPYAINWELINERLYVSSYHDGGYSTKANAKRAAVRWAEQLGLEITETEDKT
jgi:hypothetical protein